MAMSSGLGWLKRAWKVALTPFMGLRDRGILAARSWIPAARQISKIRWGTRRPNPTEREKMSASQIRGKMLEGNKKERKKWGAGAGSGFSLSIIQTYRVAERTIRRRCPRPWRGHCRIWFGPRTGR